MSRKISAKIKVIRKGELVDPRSTKIRSDQAERLKKEPQLKMLPSRPNGQIKLISTKLDELYTTREMIECSNCRMLSRTRRMFRYKQSSRGSIFLCEICHDLAEIRSFYNLDAMGSRKRKIKVG